MPEQVTMPSPWRSFFGEVLRLATLLDAEEQAEEASYEPS